MNAHPHPVHLQALADGEVGPRRRAALEAHIRSCDECRERIEELRALSRGFSLAVRRLDPAGQTALTRLAAQGAAAAEPAALALAPSAGSRVWLRAAGIVGLLATSAAAAAVATNWVRDRDAEPAALTEAAPAARLTGITVLPGAPDFRIDLSGLAPGSAVEIGFVALDSVSVDVRSAGGSASFRQADGGSALVVTVDGEAEVSVTLPRTLAGATVTVNGEVRAAKRGTRLELVESASPAVTVVAREGADR